MIKDTQQETSFISVKEGNHFNTHIECVCVGVVWTQFHVLMNKKLCLWQAMWTDKYKPILRTS